MDKKPVKIMETVLRDGHQSKAAALLNMNTVDVVRNFVTV